MRIDVVYEQMRRKTIDDLRRIVADGERAGYTSGRWFRTAVVVLREKLAEVERG